MTKQIKTWNPRQAQAGTWLGIGVNLRENFIANRTGIEVFFHEEFNEMTFDYDIGLIRVSFFISLCITTKKRQRKLQQA